MRQALCHMSQIKQTDVKTPWYHVPHTKYCHRLFRSSGRSTVFLQMWHLWLAQLQSAIVGAVPWQKVHIHPTSSSFSSPFNPSLVQGSCQVAHASSAAQSQTLSCLMCLCQKFCKHQWCWNAVLVKIYREAWSWFVLIWHGQDGNRCTHTLLQVLHQGYVLVHHDGLMISTSPLARKSHEADTVC